MPPIHGGEGFTWICKNGELNMRFVTVPVTALAFV